MFKKERGRQRVKDEAKKQRLSERERKILCDRDGKISSENEMKVVQMHAMRMFADILLTMCHMFGLPFSFEPFLNYDIVLANGMLQLALKTPLHDIE